ncbi:undecaprenyl-phosphate glucose phosphotransferase [Serratia fonticola]|uniref:undecaprenyl-phosphate glucose phosphotransferase n=1 Tax=Serratia fonticola TaxID=47917 RepID=UPI00192CC46E|nr:undecaprenyl-phosphate glucose phosphotransferase [Serratia fonticola]MBL5824662.1 undecaprenyl-phosphate glucose phosphotransferase [Serratia fonticola]
MTYPRKGRARANASLISMMQRFSDIFIIFFGLYITCLVHSIDFIYLHWSLALGVLVTFQMIGGITDFYRSWRGVSFHTEFLLIIQNWTLSLIFTVGTISIFSIFDIEYYLYLNWYILVCVGFLACRLGIRKFIGSMRSLGYNTCRVAIAGELPVGINLALTFKEAPWMGFDVVGIYSDEEKELENNELSKIGDMKRLVTDAKNGLIDRIYIAMSMAEEQKIKELVSNLSNTTCSVLLIPDVFTLNILQSRHEEINGLYVMSLFDTPMSGINMVIKRFEDIVVSLLILVFISPVLIIIAILVKLTSPGPVIFKQVRYGMDGKPIRVWKFRSMNVMENGDKVVQAAKGDVRVTSFGGFLRRTSLDELPQFINVLRGDMSIVGPRPHAVTHNEQYRALIEGYMLRHKVKPGITGWAQINGWRGETDTLYKMEKRVEFDLDYIRNWSVWLDMKIIFLTIFKGFINKSAY